MLKPQPEPPVFDQNNPRHAALLVEFATQFPGALGALEPQALEELLADLAEAAPEDGDDDLEGVVDVDEWVWELPGPQGAVCFHSEEEALAWAHAAGLKTPQPRPLPAALALGPCLEYADAAK